MNADELKPTIQYLDSAEPWRTSSHLVRWFVVEVHIQVCKSSRNNDASVAGAARQGMLFTIYALSFRRLAAHRVP
jgi:hypothetical protein